ncbi:MAG: SRPBCC domain-containing protein [Candidatus Thermoplasmatota archaeon]|jgi:carbon monoxide dehydrogenase subunit G|nr:SRPBCC domain-containing protein [Candidatus Thermoplasmatota archaeon]MCL5963823.1 SRPBCC domain-containing protein [Candidatus Thermoplasmatota archaeon]
MTIQFTGSFDIKNNMEGTRNFLLNPDKVAPCIKNLTDFTKNQDGTFDVKFKIELSSDTDGGYLNMINAKMKFILKDGDEITLSGSGRAVGSRISVSIIIKPVKIDENNTKIEWRSTIDAGLILKAIGNDKFEKIANKIIEDIISNVAERCNL